MAERRTNPYRVGMGAKEDFYSATFEPRGAHQAALRERARLLLSTGFGVEQVAEMLSLPVEEIRELKAMAA